MHRIVAVLCVAVLCSSALISGLACGKYGRPQRIWPPEPPIAASDEMIEQDDDEAQKSRKQ